MIHIKVTQKHINEAIKRREQSNKDTCGNCILAVALQEQVDKRIRVTLQQAYIPLEHDCYELPEIAKQIAGTYDDKWKDVQPCEFDIELAK